MYIEYSMVKSLLYTQRQNALETSMLANTVMASIPGRYGQLFVQCSMRRNDYNWQLLEQEIWVSSSALTHAAFWQGTVYHSDTIGRVTHG